MLQHKPLHMALPALLTPFIKRLPTVSRNKWRKPQSRSGGLAANNAFEKSSALLEWQLTNVFSLVFQHIVGHKGHRHILKQLFTHRFAADTFLQMTEGHNSIFFRGPGENFTVYHGPVR